MVGQFGFASAVPLLNQVNNLLQSRSTVDEARLPRDPRPESVGQGVICWPGGQSLPEGSENCRRRLSTWLLEGSEPPTLLLPEQEGIRGIRFPVWLDKTGKRVAADCPDATEKILDVWPLPLESWLPAAEKRAARLPAKSTVCPPLDNNNAAPLMISGIREGAVIKRLPGEGNVTLSVSTTGGEGERWWFLNGEPLKGRNYNYSLKLYLPGNYQLFVMDEAGQTATVNFELGR